MLRVIGSNLKLPLKQNLQAVTKDVEGEWTGDAGLHLMPLRTKNQIHRPCGES